MGRLQGEDSQKDDEGHFGLSQTVFQPSCTIVFWFFFCLSLNLF